MTDKVTLPAAVSRATFSHKGQSNFAVKVYTTSGSEDLLVNVIGSYKGSRPVVGEDDRVVYFEVTADGPWTINIEPLGETAGAEQGIAGTGDFVSGLFAPSQTGPIPFTFAHAGSSNFAVYLHCVQGSDLLQNEIGAVSNAAIVRFPEGPCFWEVQADGKWTIKPKVDCQCPCVR